MGNLVSTGINLVRSTLTSITEKLFGKTLNLTAEKAKHWAWRGEDGKRPLVLGHRGVPRAAQENTLAALDAAAELGIDGVEIDVMLTKDNIIVLFHDEDMDRLTGGKAAGKSVANMTYEEVSKYVIPKKLDVTGTGKFQEFACGDQKIPTLEEVLLNPKYKSLKFNVEMKAYAPNWSRRHWGTETAKLIRKCNAADRVLITSFDFFMLRTLEKEYPGLQSGWAYDDNMSDSLAVASQQWCEKTKDEDGDGAIDEFEARDSKSFVRWIMECNTVGDLIGSTIVDLEWTVFDKNTVEKFHKRGHSVGAYVFYPLDLSFVKQTLTEEEEERVIRRLYDEGVDWMETDDPEKLMKLLKKIESEKPKQTPRAFI